MDITIGNIYWIKIISYTIANLAVLTKLVKNLCHCPNYIIMFPIC